MPDRYVTKQLDARRIDQAFPVVQTAFPKISVDRWRAYAQTLLCGKGGKARPKAPKPADMAGNVVPLVIPPSSGVIVAQLGLGYIHGLFAYQVLPNLGHGKVLQVDMFVALDLFDPEAAAESLLLEMERLGRVLHCDAIHLSLPKRPNSPQLACIEQRGLHVEGLRLCKDLAVVAAE